MASSTRTRDQPRAEYPLHKTRSRERAKRQRNGLTWSFCWMFCDSARAREAGRTALGVSIDAPRSLAAVLKKPLIYLAECRAWPPPDVVLRSTITRRTKMCRSLWYTNVEEGMQVGVLQREPAGQGRDTDGLTRHCLARAQNQQTAPPHVSILAPSRRDCQPTLVICARRPKPTPSALEPWKLPPSGGVFPWPIKNPMRSLGV